MEYIMSQWSQENTRFRDNEEPSRLDLLFTLESGVMDDVAHETHLGVKSDHLPLDIILKELTNKERNEKTQRRKILTQ